MLASFVYIRSVLIQNAFYLIQLIEQQYVLTGNGAAHLCHVHLIGTIAPSAYHPCEMDFISFLGCFIDHSHMEFEKNIKVACTG